MNATPSPSNSERLREIRRIEDGSGSLGTVKQKPVKFRVQSTILSVVFLADGQHFVGGGKDGMIRQYRMKDGKEVGEPLDVESPVLSIAASRDGRWIVAGTENGRVITWDPKKDEEATEFPASDRGVNAIDISPDGTKIATASDDENADVWSLASGEWLWGWEGGDFNVAKFSPDERLFVTNYNDVGKNASFGLQIIDSRDVDKLHWKVPISAKSVAWSSDGKQLFVLSASGNIRCLDVYARTTSSKWGTQGVRNPTCISLSRNGKFITVTANDSVSFWDTSTHQRVGPFICHPGSVLSAAMSTNYDLVVADSSTVTLWGLRSALSAQYVNDQPKTEPHPKATVPERHVQRTLDRHATGSFHKTTEILSKYPAMKNTNSTYVKKTVTGENILSRSTIHAYQQKLQCEKLYADGLVIDAAKSFLNATRSLSDNIKADMVFMSWLSGFTNKCTTTLEKIGDDASEAKKHDQALAAYATALSLTPSNPHVLLTKWAAIRLLRLSIKETLDGTNEFKLSRIVVRRAICDALAKDGRVLQAIECFRQIKNEPAQERREGNGEQPQWELDFRQRCTERLGKLADIAVGSQCYNEGDRLLSHMLSLDPLNRVDILIKRSKTRVIMKSWEDALSDADEVVRLEPGSHLGYEQKHIALHGAKRYAEAVAAFDTLLLKLQGSPNIHVRGLCLQYTDARATIRAIVDSINSEMPPVLIDITTGRLFDSTQRAKAFETLPVFNELVSSMTKGVDEARIEREVKEFLRYVMFSHKWGDNEPVFKLVLRVYELEPSSGNIKLQKFCSLVRSLGIRWAWSDTCCINKEDSVVLQRSLVAMFQWYRNSFLTIIHLLGVSSLSEEPDDLQESIWNSRVWTYQEYVAAKRVLFYTEDWKPYRGLTLSNHKESRIIHRQMEVSPFSAEQVAILQPGLSRAREKLYLASTRETTLVEDIAYSLLGILDAPIPVIYGEGTRAVGRLLEYVLAGSGDVTILAWTGTANKYNSCLPLNLAVYCPLVPPHVPHMETPELNQKVAKLRSSLSDISLATTLYERLAKLPAVSMASSRLRLPCIASHFTFELVQSDARMNQYEYHATTAHLGSVKVTTSSDLDMEAEYCLVHPWICPLLDQEYARGHTGLDKTTQALRLVVRLKQAFGALLFQKTSRVGYKRVAADSLIMVQIRDTVSLTDLVDSIDIIEVQ